MAMKAKFVKGMLAGAVIAFPLGINFGKDVPLMSNPFITKPDMTDKVVERTNAFIEDTRSAIHAATQPDEDEFKQ